MLYRVAIYRNENGKRVFDHYASDSELEILKPKADGSGVEKAETLPHMITRKLALCFDDVSDTHEVEWGFEHEGKEYYENDKTRSDADGDEYCPPSYCYGIIIFRDGCFYEHTEIEDTPIDDVSEWIDVIGNIHEESK